MEVIPLIVLYAPGMLPLTCALTSQHKQIDAKCHKKQHTYIETAGGLPGHAQGRSSSFGLVTAKQYVCHSPM